MVEKKRSPRGFYGWKCNENALGGVLVVGEKMQAVYMCVLTVNMSTDSYPLFYDMKI